MASINKVILVGNLGKDPELKTMGSSGKSLCNLSLATTRTYKDAQGNRQSETEWHNVVLFDKLAENAAKYLHKGSAVYLEGALKTHAYKDKNGVEKWQTNVIATGMQFLGGKE